MRIYSPEPDKENLAAKTLFADAGVSLRPRGLPSLRAVSSTSRKPTWMPFGLEAAPEGNQESGEGLLKVCLLTADFRMPDSPNAGRPSPLLPQIFLDKFGQTRSR